MSISTRSAPSRRRFLKQLGLAGLVSSLPIPPSPVLAEQANSPLVSPDSGRPGLSAGAFTFLPLGAVRPRRWLRTQLEIQADGLSGHLDETWPDVGPNSGWLGGTGESWERGPYYLDGLVPLAYLLDNPALKQKAQRYIEWTLASQAPNGMFGPASNDDWWPRMVMLKVLTQYQEATARSAGDSTVMSAVFVNINWPNLPRTSAYATGVNSAGRIKCTDQQSGSITAPVMRETPGSGRACCMQQGHDWHRRISPTSSTPSACNGEP